MNDNELVYLIKTENLANANHYLNEKYLDFINNYQKKIHYGVTSKPLHSADLDISFAYLTLQKCVQDHDFRNKKFVFGKLVSLNSRNTIYNEIKRVYSYDKYFPYLRQIDKDFLLENYQESDTFNVNDEIPDFLNSYLENKSMKLKNLIHLKCLGWKWQEISKQLRLGQKKLQNMYMSFLKKFRRDKGNDIKKYFNE